LSGFLQELRFILPVVPVLNISAAAAIARMYVPMRLRCLLVHEQSKMK
jgi:hypothetical protein